MTEKPIIVARLNMLSNNYFLNAKIFQNIQKIYIFLLSFAIFSEFLIDFQNVGTQIFKNTSSFKNIYIKKNVFFY